MTTQGAIYVFPTNHAGGVVAQGGRTEFGGVVHGYTAFREDVWNGILAGQLSLPVGNKGETVCGVVGHEGVHIQQSYSGLGVGSKANVKAMENEAYGIQYTC